MDNTFLGVTHSHNPSGLMAVFADGVEVLVWRAHTAPNKRDFLGDYFIAEHPTYRTPDYWGDFGPEIVERRAHFQRLSDEEWQKYQTTALQNVMEWMGLECCGMAHYVDERHTLAFISLDKY